MYIFLVLLAIAIMIIYIWPKKKLRYNVKFIDRLNNALSRLHYKQDSKPYIVLQHKIERAGFNINPETFQSIRFILPFVTVTFYFLLIAINYVNLRLSINELEIAAKVLDDLTVLNVRFNVNISFILIVFLVSFLLPDMALILMNKLRVSLSKRESLTLQTYTIILLRTSKPVKEILNSLYERAQYFKPSLERANNIFSTDSKKALEELKDSALERSEFENICIALHQALYGNRKLSITYLENHRDLAREVNKQKRIRRQTRNQGIGILVLMIPLLISAALVGYPWLMITIRAIGSIPI